MAGPKQRAPRRRTRRDQGFSLIDVLIANTILVITVLGLCATGSKIGDVQRTTRERLWIERALQEKAQEVEATSFQDLVATYDGAGFDVFGPGEAGKAFATLPGDGDEFVGSISVKAAEPYADASKLVEVEIRVDAKGKSEWHLRRVLRLSRGGTL